VGLREGVQPLAGLLADGDPEVRQMAAFAMGIIGDASARDPLIAALADESPLVKGSAAEALGLIGDAGAAAAVARMASDLVAAGAVAEPPGEDADARRDTPAAALRLALFALARLKAYAPLASAVLDASGQPRIHWWPVAFALQRLEDPRAKAALLTLARDPHPYTRAFAVKGLGALKDPAAAPVVVPLIAGPDRMVAIEAIRAAARLGDASAAPALLALIQNPKADAYLRLEAITAAGTVPSPTLDDALLDSLADTGLQVRAAALRAIAQRDPSAFITVLSGLDPDPDWSVRAALASVLGTLEPAVGLPRLRAMLEDTDQRVIPAVLGALARLKASDAVSVLVEKLKADDPIVRAAAARGLAELKSAGSGAALAEAYGFGQRDTTYVARGAALQALADLRAPEAVPTLTEALADKDWALRVRAAALLKSIDPTADVDLRIRPVPTSRPADFYNASRLVAPPVSTQFYIDTDRGIIQFELAVLDAPLTVDNFITLARRGFFDGLSFHRVVPGFVVQAGDPRGDGEGGPGYTIRDELNERPYVRGTLGMALDWADTGGSQFFITQSPQPHLDAKYTVFGRVLSGMDIIDRIQAGDVIRRVRIWDGTE
jgi:cyclophilin family peptidyl-prolyl cis-trans isomerase/HEAT repeat protein